MEGRCRCPGRGKLLVTSDDEATGALIDALDVTVSLSQEPEVGVELRFEANVATRARVEPIVVLHEDAHARHDLRVRDILQFHEHAVPGLEVGI